MQTNLRFIQNWILLKKWLRMFVLQEANLKRLWHKWYFGCLRFQSRCCSIFNRTLWRLYPSKCAWSLKHRRFEYFLQPCIALILCCRFLRTICLSFHNLRNQCPILWCRNSQVEFHEWYRISYPLELTWLSTYFMDLCKLGLVT